MKVSSRSENGDKWRMAEKISSDEKSENFDLVTVLVAQLM
jgi:hypothetical protein